MRRPRNQSNQLVPWTESRSGKILVLTSALLPVLVGGLALSGDTAVLAAARGQLQTAADSAALAGAKQLASENRVRGVTDLSAEFSNARSKAIAFAQNNKILGSNAVLLDNPTNTTTGDIRMGYINPLASSTTALDQSTSSTSQFNSIQVVASRDATHGGAVPRFFGKMFGTAGRTVQVSSTGTVQNYKVAGVKAGPNNQNANLLPIVLIKSTYDAMMAGTTTDEYTYNPSTKTVTSGADGVEESRLYPVKSGDPGNWGTINVGVTSNSTSVLGSQIRNGITPAQLATFPNSKITLNSSLTPPSITFSGDPGISAGIKDDLISIIGKPVLIPIYDQTGGNGNNAWYRVIDFAPVRIVDVNFQGNPKYVIIQPALLDDPTVIADKGSPRPWTQGGVIKLYLSR